MFTSFLPTASSLKFGQNGSSKPSSRFSVRVFKAPANTSFAYAAPVKPDVSYRSASQREPQNNNWYPPNSYSTTNYEPQQRPRATANFAIYPSATNDTFIYEQSACSKSDIFSTSELDSASTSGFSPAMSTDTLPSTIMADQAAEDHRIHRVPTPAPRPVYSGPHDPQVLTRTASAGHPESGEDRRARTSSFQQQLHARPATPMHGSAIPPVPLMAEPMSRIPSSGGSRYVHIPEYAASTLSEFEVEERDRIAKINAEYNSHTSSSSSGTTTPNDADRRWTPSIPAPIPSRDNFTRVASSQPLHPNLHFHGSQSLQEPEFNAPPPPVFHLHPTSSNPYPRRDDSPPLVERISSQLAPEYGVPQASSSGHGRHPLPSVPSESWSREATFDSEQMRGTGHYRTSPKSTTAVPAAPTSQLPQELNGGSIPSSRSAHTTYATSSPETAEYRSDRRQERPLQPEPVDSLPSQHRRRSSMVGPRPDAALSRAHSEAREYGPTTPLRENNNSTYGGRDREREREDERDRRERERSRSYSDSVPPAPQVQGSPSRDTSNRATFGADIRRDTRTPVPSREADEYRSSRRDSYAPETARSSKDARGKSQPLEQARETYTTGPLTSSPTQMRMSPTELNSSPNRVSPPVHENDRAGERTRTRSTSFSQPSRPTTPAPSALHYPPLTQQPPIIYNGGPDPRQQGPSHPDQRKDTRGSNAQGAYYPQPQAPSLSPQYESTSQRQQHVSMPPPPAQTPSRSGDRSTTSTLQATSSTPHTRGVSTQERPRSSFVVEPSYTATTTTTTTQSHNPEPLRRHSDGDEPYNGSTTPFPPRSATGPGSSSTKVMLPTPGTTSVPHSGYPSGTTAAHAAEPQPQRRYSDGDQTQPPRGHASAQALSGRNSAPLLRSVRWNENLICPSPILSRQRRKGWFNRRGDQLWTNDGEYKAAPIGEEYPSDLTDYPEPGDGWMNEECVRIDLNHRFIPKPPLRSALKQSNLRG
ncbi:hypothetical protein M413DRAFT_287650 [Hebeloma cylindrosporum]|uniref:Uncharacterized protein n=1 Tax=Hebeloma cylindrosporum TaxID=76867 RepID=A0A0C3BJ37_HEBCY|nr:hypothetical protein M413DRAFT_287650 [Hebeloma cylindrosporum h7]